MDHHPGRHLAALAVVCVLLAACDQDSPQAAPPEATLTTQQPAPPSKAPPAPERIGDRCHFDVPGQTFTIPGTDSESWLSAVEFGRGPNAAVFLHETGHSFLCGWLPYAEWAARSGVRSIAIDSCGYGSSVCSDSQRRDVAAWVGSAVEWARQHGARRVTLVGASMGGTLATGVGQQVGADAVVNLSGPRSWQDVPDVVRAARSVRVPILVAAANADSGISTKALRRAVRVAPAHVKRYVATPAGHGWSMMTKGALIGSPAETHPTRLGRLLLKWIRGDVG